MTVDLQAEPGEASGAAADRQLQDPRLSLDVLTGALALSLWVAFGCLVLAITNGLGEHPVRRLVVGLLLVAGTALLLWQREVMVGVLRARPWLVLMLAAAQLAAAAADGVIGGAYVAFSLTSTLVAVIAARARTVWLCVALLELGYGTAVLADATPASLARDGHLGSVLGAMVSYPVAALLAMAVRRRFSRFVGRVEATLDDIRAGTPAFTPALGSAIRGTPLALAPAPLPALTPSERRVVEGLAAGKAAKELAHAWGLSVATVRTHIHHAKRKTGARTLRELATLPSRPDWSQYSDRGR